MKLKQAEKLLLYGGLGLFAFALYSKARALSNLIFSPGQVTGMSFQDSSPLLRFSVAIQNTSSASLTINSLAGVLFSNGTMIGNVYNFVPLVIPANAMVYADVNVQLKTLGIVNDVIQAFTSKSFTQNVNFEGYANVMGAQFPLQFAFTVGNEI